MGWLMAQHYIGQEVGGEPKEGEEGVEGIMGGRDG